MRETTVGFQETILLLKMYFQIKEPYQFFGCSLAVDILDPLYWEFHVWRHTYLNCKQDLSRNGEHEAREAVEVMPNTLNRGDHLLTHLRELNMTNQRIVMLVATQ